MDKLLNDGTSLKRKLIDIYKRYGFYLSKEFPENNVIVFTIKNGYFDNADIVPVSTEYDAEFAFLEFSKSGYACTIRNYFSESQAEEQLFKGFFSVDAIIKRLTTDYEKFTASIVSIYSPDAKYEYINAPYLINGRSGLQNPADEVISRLDSLKPTLFLIEAAAGFGKTCTAYELVNRITKKGDFLPLFSELSRNRQAVIFRYILLDEIDRTFPVLSSKLVQNEMINGRVITILDGFDELLRKNEDGGQFENHEPMLETIGEFLSGNAKIILTTRRTVLFEGDAFHEWVEKNSESFDLIRIKISEPKIADWLPENRLIKLRSEGLNVDHIANPVLLSYLRCIPDTEFDKVSSFPQELVDLYFDFMLRREKTRQDLRINPDDQQTILKSIAKDMFDYGYTSETRDYIVEHIASDNHKLLEDALKNYPSSERPSKTGLVNKLASHALLDRNTRESEKIGFVNEFVFGHFIAQVILDSDDWISDDLRFIEPAVISYQPRLNITKLALWEKLGPSLDFLSISDRIDISARIKNEVLFELKNDEAHGLDIQEILIGECEIENFQFNECIFRKCKFDLRKMFNVTFLNCKYYECTIPEINSGGPIHEFGGVGDSDIIEILSRSTNIPDEEIAPDQQLLLDRFVLEKFWPIGRDTVMHKHRPIKGVCTNGGNFKQHEIFNTIKSLKKRSILLEPVQLSFIELNFDKMIEIREIMGKSNGHSN